MRCGAFESKRGQVTAPSSIWRRDASHQSAEGQWSTCVASDESVKRAHLVQYGTFEHGNHLHTDLVQFARHAIRCCGPNSCPLLLQHRYAIKRILLFDWRALPSGTVIARTCSQQHTAQLDERKFINVLQACTYLVYRVLVARCANFCRSKDAKRMQHIHLEHRRRGP